MQYTLTLHAPGLHVQGYFSEGAMTGQRDAVVLELLRRGGTVSVGTGGLEGWMRDPYSGSTVGFLMNRSEEPRYDEMFPGHPLTQCRIVVDAFVRT